MRLIIISNELINLSKIYIINRHKLKLKYQNIYMICFILYNIQTTTSSTKNKLICVNS